MNIKIIRTIVAAFSAATVLTCVAQATVPACFGLTTVGSPASTIYDNSVKNNCGTFHLGFDYMGIKAGGDVTYSCIAGNKLVQEDDNLSCASQNQPTGYRCDPKGGTCKKTLFMFGGCNVLRVVTDKECNPDTTTDESFSDAGLDWGC